MENMDGIRFINFRRKTSSGIPFCFTIEAGDGTAGYIAKEIFSFVSAAVPEQCAREWMIQSGAMEPSEFLQAVSDMEDEYGYISLNELSDVELDLSAQGLGKLQVRKQKNFKPVPLKQIQDSRLQEFLARFE